MKHLEPEDRATFAPPYDPEDVDAEFIPYLWRINAKPFAATIQCCIGHCEYHDAHAKPANSAGRWGYLKLLMTGPSAVQLFRALSDREWLILGLSKGWSEQASEMPEYTPRNNFIIAFAWDASSWPTPAGSRSHPGALGNRGFLCG